MEYWNHGMMGIGVPHATHYSNLPLFQYSKV